MLVDAQDAPVVSKSVKQAKGKAEKEEDGDWDDEYKVKAHMLLIIIALSRQPEHSGSPVPCSNPKGFFPLQLTGRHSNTEQKHA